MLAIAPSSDESKANKTVRGPFRLAPPKQMISGYELSRDLPGLLDYVVLRMAMEMCFHFR